MTARVEAERAIAGAVRQIVADYALGTESLHANWRCGYPDTYGPCSCVDEFVADAVKVLADLIAERQAEAWDEGWRDCAQVEPDDAVIGDNPYRPDPKDTRDE